MKIKLIIDSSADAPTSVRSQCNIVPLTVNFGDKEYLDGIDLDYDSFYQKLENEDVFPMTSQPSPARFDEVYKQTLKEADYAIVITISSKLSGTYQSACLAAQEYEDRIYVLDSATASIGTGLLVQRALTLIEKGLDVKEVMEQLNKEKENIVVMGVPSTLDYLHKGGRISSVSALAGSFLSIKPILHVSEGAIGALGKTRGMKKAYHFMNDVIEKHGGIDKECPYVVSYSGTEDSLVQQYLDYSKDLWIAAPVIRVCSAIGTHLGPGAILMAYFKK